MESITPSEKPSDEAGGPQLTPTAEVWSGREAALEIEEEVRRRVNRLAFRGHPPRLEVLLVGDNAASRAYVDQKSKGAQRVGIAAETRGYPASLSEEELLGEIDALNRDPTVDGILVQLPLPNHLDADRILERLDPAKDVDGFHPTNLGRLVSGDLTVVPCTPLGIVELLRWYRQPTCGREVVVIGRSRTVGTPLALLLARKGSDATVTLCHIMTRDLASHCRRAEILISAVGSAFLIRADMVRPGAVVIDVGISRVPDASSARGYRLVGDVDFDNARYVARAITPVRGGVGPLTVAMLLRNTVAAAERRAGFLGSGV